MIVQDRALVLRVRDFSETSQIVALWTEGNGRVAALAKGVARARRFAFDGPFEPAAEYEVGFYPRPRGEGLCILSEASQVRLHPAPRRSLEAWWAWSEAAEGVLELTQEMDPHPGLADALRGLLAESESRPDALFRFQRRLLELTGHAPVLDRCAACSDAVPPGRLHFAFWSGGAVCPSCAPGAGPVALVPAALRPALAGDEAPLPVAASRRAESLLGRYAAHLSGRAPVASACRERARQALRRLIR